MMRASPSKHPVPLLRRRFDGKQCGVQAPPISPQPVPLLRRCSERQAVRIPQLPRIALGISPSSARLVVQKHDEAVAHFVSFLEFPT